MHQSSGDLTPEQLKELLQAAALGSMNQLQELSDEERMQLKAWLEKDVKHQTWQQELILPERLQALSQQYDRFTEVTAADLERFHQQHMEKSAVVPFRKQRWWWAAAAVFCLVSGTYVWLKLQQKPAQQPQTLAVTADLPPGKDGAVLTLADGRKLVLDSMGNGVVAAENGATVILQDKRLTYESTGETTPEVTYNTMSTPRGRQYNLILPDGSRVWLNAASSLHFPTAFTGKQRTVELSGEAYFEIAENSSMPFVVTSKGTAITVLGTHFNVMAYPDDHEMVTTLLSGAVKLEKGKQHVILQPGQMALTADGTEQISKTSAEVDDAVAWKNGYFVFKNESVQNMMKRVARWYDVDIQFQGNLDSKQFGGTFSRSKTLAQLLSNLELTQTIHFKIEGKKVIVFP